MTKVSMDMLDLAALLCSRVCHDVISPVGAIVNGLEVLENESEASMRDFALELIKKSATQASARLQFCRLAFGAAGSAGAMIDLGDAHNVAKGFLNDGKLSLVWDAPRLLLPKNQVKLLLNLLIIATGAIPRGGVLTAQVEMNGEEATFIITAKGINARIPPKVEQLINGEHEGDAVDAHAVQPFYTGLLAQAASRDVTFSIAEDTVTIRSDMKKAQDQEAPTEATTEQQADASADSQTSDDNQDEQTQAAQSDAVSQTPETESEANASPKIASGF